MIPERKLPLFIVTGASGVGKSTLCERLFKSEKEYIVMESDLLWNDFFNTPDDGYFKYRSLWMRVCANISQIGKPVVLCGCAVPEQFENHSERDYFTCIYYIAIVCDNKRLEHQMRNNRNISDESHIKNSLKFNNWLKNNAKSTSPEISLIDITNLDIEAAVKAIDEWILSKILIN